MAEPPPHPKAWAKSRGLRWPPFPQGAPTIARDLRRLLTRPVQSPHALVDILHVVLNAGPFCGCVGQPPSAQLAPALPQLGSVCAAKETTGEVSVMQE